MATVTPSVTITPQGKRHGCTSAGTNVAESWRSSLSNFVPGRAGSDEVLLVLHVMPTQLRGRDPDG